MADLIVTNLTGQSELLTDYSNLIRKRRVNGNRSLSFLLYETECNKHAFSLVVEESIVELDDEHYRVKRMRERTVNGTPVKEIGLARHIFEDIVDSFQYETITGLKNFVQLADHVFANTEWTYVNQGAFVSLQVENFGDSDCLSLFNELIDRTGAEYTLNSVTKTVTFRNEIGKDTDAQFRYGHNLKTLYKDVDSSNLSTYIKGYGKTTKDSNGNFISQITAEYTSPNAVKFGLKHAPVVRDESFVTVDSLQEHIEKVITDEPDVTLDVEFIELKNNGLTLHNFELGDYVHAIWEPLGIDLKLRVLEITDHPADSTKSPVISLSNVPLTLTMRSLSGVTGSIANTQKTLKNLTDKDGNLALGLKRLYRNSNHFSDETGDWYIAPDDPSAYVHIGAGGLDVHRGLIRVEREDGFPTLIGGKLNQDFSIQGSEPPQLVDTNIVTRFFANNIMSTNGGVCNLYTFSRSARYVVFHVAIMSSLQGAQSKAILTQSGVDDIWLSSVSTLNTTEDEKVFYVDLGTPDNSIFALKLRLKSYQANNTAYCRVIRAYQTDFLPSGV